MMKAAAAAFFLLLSLSAAFAFIPAPLAVQQQPSGVASRRAGAVVMMAGQGEDLKNRFRAARKPGPNDRVVELNKPLGIVLEEDEKGNVYVKDLTPGGNAARSGKVQQGDLVTMISATFGDEMWSARNAGLSMIMQAIKIRQGTKVQIVLEKSKRSMTEKKPAKAAPSKPAAPKAPAKSQDQLLAELQNEEKGRKKFFGLF